ncbi:sorting nexin-2 [Eurytemora carolleeae]|uniref:sorting nexin-2 n=1 Tax=Eurytemora carolleeae TaxID=1294199 RepID=UPI000C76292F|nr:sorting nexin-2 [Eurytemora carolleeae]|eukprot:XP_023339479.1 sorting nexin-2-like [Eurytemora affinis]
MQAFLILTYSSHIQLSQPATLTSFHDLTARNELEGGDEYIDITITSPHKVGDGMNSFMAFKVNTKTNLSFFKKKESVVTRRFSDFLGLRDKLTEKYLQNGRIIPPAPDKSVLGMTKVKMSKEDDVSDQSDFVEKRRAALERYLNRTAAHQNLRVDPDFREFLELDAELPKANSTAALSNKNIMKIISKVGDKMTAYTTKMDETDQWFEEKTVMVENLDLQLRKLLTATEALVYYRKSLTGHTYTVAKGLAALGNTEENTKLSAVLDQLSEVYLKVEKVHEEQAKDDFFLLSELVHDYIGIVGSVKDVLNERLKAWQAWQGVQKDLNKRREGKARAELGGKLEKVQEINNGIKETERQLDMAQENFEKISRTIKKEFEVFEARKNQDFRQTIVKYLEKMLKAQENLVSHWERFLPEIKQLEL